MAPVFTNLNIYLAIAEEALVESTRQLEAHRTPKPHAQPGYILSPDPEHKSFKQSLIALAFAGMYLEALVSLIGRARMGKGRYKKIEGKKYEEKLRRLGVEDQILLASCTRFREARNDLMHEKAVDIETWGSAKIRWAQKEAVLGVKFVKSMASKLQPTPDG